MRSFSLRVSGWLVTGLIYRLQNILLLKKILLRIDATVCDGRVVSFFCCIFGYYKKVWLIKSVVSNLHLGDFSGEFLVSDLLNPHVSLMFPL